MTIEAAAPDLVGDLLRGEAYPHRPRGVELIETHISWLFLAGHLVYKVRKPVDLGFLDFRRPEARRRDCEEELRLGRRLTPWVYLGVRALTRGPDGRLRVGGAGAPVEYAVEMVRLPAERMLSARLDRGQVDNALLERLATRVAELHAAAPTGAVVDEFGTPEAVDALVRENLLGLGGFTGDTRAAPAVLSPDLHAFLTSRQLGFVAANRELLARRVSEGRIRDGHGDLHAGNVCDTTEGLALYDPLEFSARFRCADTACELAFLTMDLDRRGFAAFARYLVRRYAELAGDPDVARLVPFYSCYRALVRAKVGAIGAAQRAGTPEGEASRREAMRCAHLAASYELRPCLVLVAGEPSDRKASLARDLARAFHGTLHAGDARRPDADLLRDAVAELEQGRTVVVDAAFDDETRRRPFTDAAARLGHPFHTVDPAEGGAPEDVCAALIEHRLGLEGGAAGR